MKLWETKPLLRSPDAYIGSENIRQYLAGCKNILIIGDAGGIDFRHLSEAGREITVLDIAPQPEIPGVVVQSIEDRTPFEDQQFDGVVMKEVLEHLFRDVAALEEVHRILKDDGVLGITVPYLSNMQDKPEWHVRVHSKKTMRRLLERTGFKVEEHFYRGFMSRLPGLGFSVPRLLIYISIKTVEKIAGKTPNTATHVVNGVLNRIERWLGARDLTATIQKWFTAYGGIMKTVKVSTRRDFDKIQIDEFSNK